MLLLALLLLFTAGGLSRTAAFADSDTVTLQVKGRFIIDSTRQMLDNINDLRANDAWYWNSEDTEKIWVTDLSPLVYDYALERMAMQRAAELAVTYSHTRPNGERCFSAFPSEYSWSSVGENIAYGYTSADSVFTAWAEADDPYAGQGHRRNMLNSMFTGVGIGCFECEGVLFWAQEFSSPETHAAESPLTSPVSMEVLQECIASASLGGQITLHQGHSVELSSIELRVKDNYSPGLSVPCYIPESAFSIADTGIARISGGKIEGLQNGETTLTADYGGLTVSALVVVTEDDTIPLHLDTPVSVDLAAGELKLFSFTPSESGDYRFYSSGGYDTCGYLYDSAMNELAFNDDGGEGNNFSISCQLDAGTQYYFGARMYSGTASGSFTVTLEAVAPPEYLPLQLDTPLDVDIAAGEMKYFSFTPSESDDYVFYSSGSYDTCGYLYDSRMNQLAFNDDSSSSRNFSLSCQLEAETQYYFGARMYSSSESGTITVTLEKDSSHYADGFTYKLLDDGTASIIGCSLSGDIAIPDTLDGYTVSNLGAKLFYGRSNVTSVSIPASVSYFGENRNDNMWDYVFSYCYGLQNIYVAEDNPTFESIDGVLFLKNGLTLVNYPCSHPGEVYHVSAGTLCCTSFASCSNLRFLFLGNPNTTWYTYTFYNTDGLTKFYLTGGRTEQKAAQAGSTFVPADEIVSLPEDLQRIESEAFRDTSILYLSVPDGCTRIEAGAFTGSALAYAQVGASTVIESGAFDSSVVVERR